MSQSSETESEPSCDEALSPASTHPLRRKLDPKALGAINYECVLRSIHNIDTIDVHVAVLVSLNLS